MGNSKEIKEKFDQHIITSHLKKMQPVVIAEASGAIVKDPEGNEYLDAFAGIAVTNAGHGNPKILEAAKSQLDKLVHVCTYVYYHEPAALLAEKLAQLTPPRLMKSFLANSGAEAVECALKIGRRFTRKSEILSLMGSFHGRTIAALSVTGQAKYKNPALGPFLGEITFVPAPYCYRCSLGLEYPQCNLQCAQMIEDIIRFATKNNVAELIGEPIMGEGGIIVPPPGYWEKVKQILDDHEILFIADEVQSGFGRTGKLFGYEHYDVEPDMVTMAKGIAAGFPISSCTVRADIAEAFQPGDHLSTFGGNPVACAAALANIQVMEDERLPEQSRTKGEYTIKRLQEVAERNDRIGDVRGTGLMIGIEIVKDKTTKAPDPTLVGKIRDYCLTNRILIGSGGAHNNVLRLQPPLVISTAQLDQIIDTLETALKTL